MSEVSIVLHPNQVEEAVELYLNRVQFQDRVRLVKFRKRLGGDYLVTCSSDDESARNPAAAMTDHNITSPACVPWPEFIGASRMASQLKNTARVISITLGSISVAVKCKPSAANIDNTSSATQFPSHLRLICSFTQQA